MPNAIKHQEKLLMLTLPLSMSPSAMLVEKAMYNRGRDELQISGQGSQEHGTGTI